MWALVLWVGCGAQGGASPSDAGGSACGAEPAANPSPCRADATATVTRVVDGDTIHVDVGGRDEAVRLLGVDAPESDEAECGSGARDWLRARLPIGTEVTLSFDVECVDDYGRTLAYVEDAAGLVNGALVAEGQAEACPYEPNTNDADWLACLESEASAADAGLWAIGCHLDPCFR